MEIERKWLVDPAKIPYKLNKLEREEIEQAYISFSPVIRVRSINEKIFFLTVKTNPLEGNGQFSREEHEFPITSEDYSKLLAQSKGRIIRKTRYINPLSSGLKEEIDIFSGDLQGLAYLEIEFPDEQTAENYSSPEWVERDVSNEPGYSNADLASGNGVY
jgi:Uncharacterized protein conserved in bacteria